MSTFFTRLVFNTLAALAASYFLSGVHIKDVSTALLVALVLGLLNTFVKPILVILTIPITLITLGLFLIVINILIIKWTADIVPGFSVDNWLWALLFSIIFSILSSVFESLLGKKDK